MKVPVSPIQPNKNRCAQVTRAGHRRPSPRRAWRVALTGDPGSIAGRPSVHIVSTDGCLSVCHHSCTGLED